MVEGSETDSYKMTENTRDVDAGKEKTQGNMTASLKYVKICCKGEYAYFILLQGRKPEQEMSLSNREKQFFTTTQ